MKTLFDQPLSHRADPVTSYIAAEKLAKSGGWTRQQKKVYAALEDCNGCTAGEIGAFMTGDRTANRYIVSRRMPELRDRGLVKEGPKRLCQILHSLCVTWWLAGTKE